ncbi:hypothetical protein H1R20_g12369, partial [Candolleomyces eurysporus]
MYRMAILSMLTTDQSLDVSKLVCFLLLLEPKKLKLQDPSSFQIVVGDITPHENFTKEEKHRLEQEAMNNFVHTMLHNSPAAQRIEALWREYEAGETPEAKFVKGVQL